MLIICSSEATTTEIHYLGVTYSWNQAVEFGYFPVRGEPYVVGPVPFPTISHDGFPWGGSGARHGAMINPDQEDEQGYDSRAPNYVASRNVMLDPPATLAVGETLCKAISLNPNNASIGTGGSATAIDVMSVLHCLADHPAVPSFAPPFAGTDKTLTPLSAVNHALSPAFATPTGPITPVTLFTNTDAYLASPMYDLGDWAFMRFQLRPQSAFLNVYPSTCMHWHGWVIAQSLLDIPEANTLRNRIVQAAIDYKAISDVCDDGLTGGAGFGASALLILLYGGYFLEDAAMLAVGQMTTTTGYSKFGEQAQYYSSTSAWNGYILPQPFADYPSGPPLFGDEKISLAKNWSGRNLATQDLAIAAELQDAYHDAFPYGATTDYDPIPPLFSGDTEYTNEPAGTYMAITAHGSVSSALLAILLGIDSYFENDATIDFFKRYVNDMKNMASGGGVSNYDYFVFGGTSAPNQTGGRNLMTNLWLSYAPGRPTLTNAAATATGATTADIEVETDTGNGKIWAVATLSATKPSPLNVRNGLNTSNAAAPSASTDFLTTTGLKQFSISGLTTGVQQWIHYCHVSKDAAFSAVVTAGPITPS